MKVFIGSLLIFFGTLLAAGLVALGQPGDDGKAPVRADAAASPGGASGDRGWERLFAIRGLR